MENRIEKIEKRLEKIERNMTNFQENLNTYHYELEQKFNRIKDPLLTELLLKEATAGNEEALHLYLHPQ